MITGRCKRAEGGYKRATPGILMVMELLYVLFVMVHTGTTHL